MVTLKTIDAYIKDFPKETQAILKELRQAIREELPEEIEETISYGIPTFKLNGKYVVYFAGFKKHVSVYPILEEADKILPEITAYKKGRGTLHFPLDKPLPFQLIRKVVRLLLQANRERTGK